MAFMAARIIDLAVSMNPLDTPNFFHDRHRGLLGVMCSSTPCCSSFAVHGLPTSLE